MRRAGFASRALRAIALAAVVLGCASGAQRDAAAARERYAQCVAVAGERACAAERERMLAAERAYEEQARRAWACDPGQPDCPTPR